MELNTDIAKDASVMRVSKQIKQLSEEENDLKVLEIEELGPLPYKKHRINQQNLEVFGVFDPYKVIPYVLRKEKINVFIKGTSKTFIVKGGSHRYHTFTKSMSCAACAIRGKFLILEQHRKSDVAKPHFNLYAVENNELLLMGKDHIVPRSLGGRNNITNYQTMCIICNNAKGSAQISNKKIVGVREEFVNKQLQNKQLQNK